jgi:opacity protein-like surface antigen
MDKVDRTLIVGCLIVLVGVLSMPLLASAEWYADLYGGGAFTQNTTGRQISNGGFSFTVDDLKVDESFTGGGRAGYWFESLPWYGAGLDVFYFQPNIPQQTARTTSTTPFSNTGLGFPFENGSVGNATANKISLSAIGIGFDVLRLRVRLLKNDAFPHGRLQPYVTAGPALFITKVGVDHFTPTDQSKTVTSWGYKAGAGVSYHITKLVGLFVEYRFTHFKTDVTFRDDSVFSSEETLQATFNTHHGIAGLSFRF